MPTGSSRGTSQGIARTVSAPQVVTTATCKVQLGRNLAYPPTAMASISRVGARVGFRPRVSSRYFTICRTDLCRALHADPQCPPACPRPT
eukprot:2600439-Pyramimonas_sp.AAC.1